MHYAYQFLVIIGAIFSTILGTQQKDSFFLMTHDELCHDINLDSEQLHREPNRGKTTLEDRTLYTASGIPVPVRIYDRQSDTVLVLGQGLPAPKESMRLFASLCPEYDIVLFDYRWNKAYEHMLVKSVFRGTPVQDIIVHEQEEVNTVLDYVTRRKKYAKVVGLAECYSTFLFAKTQVEGTQKRGRGHFTHLIFDSCWYSLRSLADSVCADPYLPLSPQKGGAPWFIKSITNSRCIKSVVLTILFKLVPNISIAPYLSKLDIPLLFVHGRKDLFVPQGHFAKIWDIAPKLSRSLLSTPYNHSDNLHNKLLYQYMIDRFVQSSGGSEFEKRIVAEIGV